jgi:putative tryptophan/tyrosine transport system substrate-binding protein
MGGKWLEVLKQAIPPVRRALALMHEETAAHRGFWQSMREAGERLSVDVIAASVHNPAEITEAISSFATRPDGGVISFPHAVTNANSKLIVELEMRYRLPGLYTGSGDGSVVSYGIDWTDQMSRSAEYVNRILRGASPSDLPVQAPTRYVLTVNLKTARAIGAQVSPSVLLLADEVIE